MRGEARMAAVKCHALAILQAFVLSDGTAGTVEAIWLDDLHGLRVSIKGHPGKRPVSTIKFVQS
jgi:hypothetical protein